MHLPRQPNILFLKQSLSLAFSSSQIEVPLQLQWKRMQGMSELLDISKETQV